jgi:Family of unknown function (DUF5678)
MDKQETYPAPVLNLRPPDDKWQREYHAFLRLLPGLLETHRGKYVAVHEGKVVDSGEDLVSVALRSYDRFGYVPIYVDLVAEHPLPPIRIPTPRLVSSEPTQ